MQNSEAVIKEPESTAVVRFQDCDPFGHLNNARYIEYFFNAREDQLADYYDFHIFERGKKLNENWVVSKTQIAYLQPAQVMEQVVIRTCLVDFSETTLTVEGIMFNLDKTRPKAVSWVEFSYVSLATGRVISHPADVMDFARSIRLDGEFQPDGFNRRVEDVRSAYRRQRQAPQRA